MGDGRWVDELVLHALCQLSIEGSGVMKRTGTFFCDNTTAQSFPLMPIDMIFAAVTALKAYSVWWS